MRAGYVVSGVVFLSLGTVFGLVGMVLGIYYAILNASGSFCSASTTTTTSQLAVCSAYSAATIITIIAALIFYSVGTLFLWNGFKAPTLTHIVTVMQPAAPVCPNCKAQVSPGQRFCANCGTKLA